MEYAALLDIRSGILLALVQIYHEIAVDTRPGKTRLVGVAEDYTLVLFRWLSARLQYLHW